MDPRYKIPAIALLGLSCSECTERSGDGSDGLVGDWEAIEIDGEKYPRVEKDGASELRLGWELRVTADAGSTLATFQEFGYADVVNRIEYYSDAEIDESAAPKYRLTVKADLLELRGDEPYSSTEGNAESGAVTDTGYADTGYADSGYGGSDTDASGGDGLDEDERVFDEFERELVDMARPPLAGGLVFDCELKAEQLSCVRQVGAGDDGDSRAWTFARVVDED